MKKKLHELSQPIRPQGRGHEATAEHRSPGTETSPPHPAAGVTPAPGPARGPKTSPTHSLHGAPDAAPLCVGKRVSATPNIAPSSEKKVDVCREKLGDFILSVDEWVNDPYFLLRHLENGVVSRFLHRLSATFENH